MPTPKILFIACGALAKETREIIDKHGWRVDLKALPALHHATPHLITRDLDKMLAEIRPNYNHVIAVYGYCGAKGIDDVLAKHNAVRISGPHCYEMYAGAEKFAKLTEEQPGTFYLTDWLLRAYEKAVVAGMGLDKHPDLAPIFFANYHRLVYLSQSPTDKLLAKGQQIADSMGWSFEHHHTGYGELETRLVEFMQNVEAIE